MGMMINFPDSPWFKNYYPKTQEISSILLEMERVSKGKCTCSSTWSHDKCDVCIARNLLDDISMMMKRKEIGEVLERNKKSKKRR